MTVFYIYYAPPKTGSLNVFLHHRNKKASTKLGEDLAINENFTAVVGLSHPAK
ncbi:hypothetical protein D3C78_1781140 [compost metagenome]